MATTDRVLRGHHTSKLPDAKLTKRARAPELLSCHDCGAGVSFSAVSCPHCGSREPAGPYVHGRGELRRLRAEERNDRTLILAVAGCGLFGVFFGAMTASGTFGAVLSGMGYGTIGLLLGVPVGFVINVTRHIGRR